VFDKARVGFLDFVHFVVRNHESSLSVRAFLPFLVTLLGLSGCGPRSAPGTVEDSTTSGRISVVCAAEVYDLFSRECSAFRALYPRATIDVRVGTSREAIAALFGARCDLAVIARELEQEEREAEVRGRVPLEGYRFARDALVVMVNEKNPVENLSLDEVRRMYRGKSSRWSETGGPGGAVVPVIQPLESDLSQFFQQQVMGEQPIGARVVYARSDSDAVARVKEFPGAVAYASLAAPVAGTKVVRLASLTGLPYWKPDLEALYKGEYPLTRFFNLYVRERGPRLANGLITYITSWEGQRLVRDSGRVPTSVPVRFVRRSPMLSTHSGGERN
jgi:phosphate transport system substrate-binding protein